MIETRYPCSIRLAQPNLPFYPPCAAFDSELDLSVLIRSLVLFGQMVQTDKKRVAIVGSGCAGLGAAWALQNTDHEVHIFEKSDRLGGHTNTQTFTHGKHSTPVDTGFIVMNSATYRSS